jgi:mycothiol synthase
LPIRLRHLDSAAVQQVLHLLDAAAGADGDYPLSEHVVLHVRHGGDADVRHLLVCEGDELVGYAHVDVTDPVAGSSAEMAVHPDHRRRGIGRALVEAALDESPDGRLRLWAHGEHPAATALAHRLGFARERVLFQMRRSLLTDVPAPDVPDGVRIRPFQVGRDEDTWVRVNSRAFADHPDQGRWTRRDLELREAEPWFDPDGFLLAERRSDGALLGFHWTKVHEHESNGQAHDPVGEVYVLGVDPAAQGMRLGPALTLAGLRYLRAHGLPTAMLYVDESNTRAVRLYEGLGFTRWSTDVCFARD